jgi:hypothetical protein
MGGHKTISGSSYPVSAPLPVPPTTDWNTAILTYHRDVNDIVRWNIKFASPMDVTKTPPINSMECWVNGADLGHPTTMLWLNDYNLTFTHFFEYPITLIEAVYAKGSPAITNIAQQEYDSKILSPFNPV